MSRGHRGLIVNIREELVTDKTLFLMDDLIWLRLDGKYVPDGSSRQSLIDNGDIFDRPNSAD